MLIEIVFGLILLYFLWQSLKKPSDYPPGYWGLPLVGYIPLSSKCFDDHLVELYKKYGDVAMWRMGTRTMVFVFDYKLIKTINNREFPDRPNMLVTRFITEGKNLGIVGSNGKLWHNGRRFTLRHLRDLGMGKSKLVSVVQHEAIELVKDLKSRAGKPTTIPHSLTVAILNVIWQMVASKRYTLDDPEIHRYEETVKEFQDCITRLMIPDFMPWIHYVLPPFIIRRVLKLDFSDEVRRKFTAVFENSILEHEEKLDEDNPSDYIDDYLVEMKKQKNDENSTMSMGDLLASVSDLFFAGSETTRTMLHWIFLYLANYPEVQKRLQEEIDQVLPKEVHPTLADKPRLAYTEAVIHEVLRHCSMLPISVVHEATNDIQVNGCKIPKGAIINAVSGWVHYDPQFWNSPHEFRPERFLNEENKFVHPKEGFMPFGLGKRQCLGEPLARMELIIFLTIIVQSLQFSPPPGKTIDLSPEPLRPTAHFPKEKQEVLITIR